MRIEISPSVSRGARRARESTRVRERLLTFRARSNEKDGLSRFSRFIEIDIDSEIYDGSCVHHAAITLNNKEEKNRGGSGYRSLAKTRKSEVERRCIVKPSAGRGTVGRIRREETVAISW